MQVWYETSSCAVAERPRDASCLAVVTASTVQYVERSSVLLDASDLPLRYNELLFCCVPRNVEA